MDPEPEPGWLDPLGKIRAAIDGLLETIICAIKRAYCWLSDLAIDWAVEAVGVLVGLFPDLETIGEQVEDAMGLYAFADHWFPLTEGLAVLAALSLWMVAVYGLRFLRSLLPF